MSERRRPSIFWLFAAIAVPAMSVPLRLRIAGAEKVPSEGSFVLAPNHYTEIDPVVMGLSLWHIGREPRFLAKAGLFRIPVIGALLSRSGQIPVERGGSPRGSGPLDAVHELVEKKRSVIVYPEGSLTRDPDLWPMRGKSGAVRIALENGIPIIPAAHWGAQKLMPRYGKTIRFLPRSTVHVVFGDPVDLSRFAGRPLDGPTLAEATEVVMAEITALLETLRDEKAPAARWNPSDHDQKDTGRFEP